MANQLIRISLFFTSRSLIFITFSVTEIKIENE